MSTQYDFIVIGSGPAGQKAAIQGAKEHQSVLLIESEPHIGGMCVHKGTIPSKALRETALRLQDARQLLNRDQPVELHSLMSRVGEVVSSHDSYIGGQLDRNGIQRVRGRARFISPKELEIARPGGSRELVSGEKIFIATGSVPRHPPGFNVDHEYLLDSDSVLSMHYLPKSMVVLGGGVIACEYASVFSSLGCEVTLIERYPRPLGFLDDELARRFISAFEASGGRFLGNTVVRSAAWDGVAGVYLQLEDNTRLHAEKLLIAQGRVSNLSGLNIQASGVQVTDLGLIAVDLNYQTNVPGIYAIGDVIGPPGLASSAMEQGRWAACHALGKPRAAADLDIPVGIYAIPELASVGLSEQQAISTYGRPRVGYAEFREVARGLIAGNTEGMLKMVADPEGKLVLGVHIIGDGATELIHLGQLALVNKMQVSAFVDQIFNFPTLAEAYRVAALHISGQVSGGTAAPKKDNIIRLMP
ncbi:MAG: Si-specific NAD(P)(+) transhydrogenase [Pseudomonadales bacterium]|nr:Si-specific NAD(P)(+) transhydrogenase [Pseudomonadales bacterium]